MRSSAGLERRGARCGWLALPEGNATGFALFEFCISAKWLEMPKQIDHERRVLLSAESAQSHEPGPASARLCDQAAELPCRAGQGSATQYLGNGRAHHAASDRRGARSRAGLLYACQASWNSR